MVSAGNVTPVVRLPPLGKPVRNSTRPWFPTGADYIIIRSWFYGWTLFRARALLPLGIVVEPSPFDRSLAAKEALRAYGCPL